MIQFSSDQLWLLLLLQYYEFSFTKVRTTEKEAQCALNLFLNRKKNSFFESWQTSIFIGKSFTSLFVLENVYMWEWLRVHIFITVYSIFVEANGKRCESSMASSTNLTDSRNLIYLFACDLGEWLVKSG